MFSFLNTPLIYKFTNLSSTQQRERTVLFECREVISPGVLYFYTITLFTLFIHVSQLYRQIKCYMKILCKFCTHLLTLLQLMFFKQLSEKFLMFHNWLCYIMEL